MSLKANIVANYASQLYVTVIGIVLVPVYLRWMGSEAYGLVGFFAMLQAWFNVLDLGLTPTIARESARYHGGSMSALDYRRLVRCLSLIFGAVALAGASLLVVLAEPMAGRWLHFETLRQGDVLLAVQVMGVSVAMRWMTGLYRGILQGAERLVWLGAFNVLIATLRFVAVLGSMAFWGATPAVFFWHQFVVAAFELVALGIAARRQLPRDLPDATIGWSFAPVKPVLRFSLSIAFISSVWVLVTQSDKLILSGLLPLADYGHFTLAVLMASGITVVAGPISTAIMPRMARLHAEGRHDELIALYNQGAQLVSVIAGSVAVALVVAAAPLLHAWTGDADVTRSAAPILRLYALGNGLLALGAFPYYLQYARGQLRYHIIGNVLMVLLLVPAIVGAAWHSGATGAGWAWAGVNALYLLIWVAYVHGRLEPGLHGPWLRKNVAASLLPAALVGAALSLLPGGGSRWSDGLHGLLVLVGCSATAAIAAPFTRQLIARRWSRQSARARA